MRRKYDFNILALYNYGRTYIYIYTRKRVVFNFEFVADVVLNTSNVHTTYCRISTSSVRAGRDVAGESLILPLSLHTFVYLVFTGQL